MFLQPPHKTDLAPSDFFLDIKTDLKRQHLNFVPDASVGRLKSPWPAGLQGT